jgi:structure-specific endonuclease subunit SLX1
MPLFFCFAFSTSCVCASFLKNFFCCYLLTSLNPSFVNRTYIGFTTDPMRRIRQHNGEIEGGAAKTSKRRPWTMIMVIYGFTSKNAALRFEWAWQNPKQSLLTREAVAMSDGLGAQDHVRTKLHIVYAMLGVEPFVRFPLTVNFFTNAYHKYLEGCSKPPPHVRIQGGSPDSLYM